MLRVLFLSALCGATLSADTIIGDFGAGAVSGFVTGGYVFVGQTFTVPTPDSVLTTWQIHMQHRDAENIGFQIFEFTGGAIQFPALYDTLVPLATEVGVIDLTGLNLPLVSGQTYIAAYHLFPPNKASDSSTIPCTPVDRPRLHSVVSPIWKTISQNSGSSTSLSQPLSVRPQPPCRNHPSCHS